LLRPSFNQAQALKSYLEFMMNRTKQIMIADDDDAILDALGAMLEYKGYEVRQALNGKGLTEMEHDLPDLLLLDIWMSGVDGRDICKKLKAASKTAKIPIVLFSASKDIQSSAIEAGANDFLAKPFEIEDLYKMIELHTAG
jgi:CheY-like chemotaxis protein